MENVRRGAGNTLQGDGGQLGMQGHGMTPKDETKDETFRDQDAPFQRARQKEDDLYFEKFPRNTNWLIWQQKHNQRLCF